MRLEIPNGLRADGLTDADVARLRPLLTTLSVSAESGVQRVVDEVVGKRLDLGAVERVAAACRRELADYLLDQRIDAARSATLHELGSLVRDELTIDPDAFVAAATAARFGPPAGAVPAAHRARRELRALRRNLRARVPLRDRLRGLVSLRSFGFVS